MLISVLLARCRVPNRGSGLSASRGLDVDSPIFRSSIQLQLCKVQSKLKQHEEALETCDEVVKTLTGNFSGIFVDPSEALLMRAEVR